MPFQLPAYPTEVSLPNGLICFTNCLLPMQDGSLVEKDLWIDERRGIVLDSQVRKIGSRTTRHPLIYDLANVLLKDAAAR
jgi:N-acetylglucosamine-6-phosphate deacetylase